MAIEIATAYLNDAYYSLLTGAALTYPDRWLALFTSAWVETTDPTYARIDVSAGIFAAPTAGHGTNSGTATFSFTNLTTITHFALMDDPTAGAFVIRDALVSPKTIIAGGTLDFTAGTLVGAIDPA